MFTEKPTPVADRGTVNGPDRSAADRHSLSSNHAFDDFPSVTYLFDNIPSLLPSSRRANRPIHA